MSRTLTISDTGLKLIKAFEGYRPVDRETVTGQRVVGYGHRLRSDEAVQLSKQDAEDLLRTDLAPFEDMIRDEVHAPLSQSQFDALCSFAFSIGPRAFLQSDTLRALNNGRVLDAANGIDVWRKSEIDGKVYVVDALVRRRTAEKALFLRLGDGAVLPADRVGLESQPDETVSLLSTEDALPVFTRDDANGVVATAPYDAKVPEFGRRREDGPAGVLELSEILLPEDEDGEDVIAEDIAFEVDPDVTYDLVTDRDGDDGDIDDITDGETDEAVQTDTLERESPIAAAATDIVDRLEALIDQAGDPEEDGTEDWPQSLITPAEGLDTTAADVDLYKGAVLDAEGDIKPAAMAAAAAPGATKSSEPVAIIDDLAADDAMREGRETAARERAARNDSAGRYILKSDPAVAPDATLSAKPTARSSDGLAIPIVLGLMLLGGGLSAILSGADARLGEWGPLLAFAAMVIGGLMFLIAIYYALRGTGARRND